MSDHGSRAPSALVTDASRGSALAIIRSLGRAGWRVIAADVSSRGPAMHSRYANATVIYPQPQAAPSAFVDAIVAAVEQHHVDLVIPVTDDTGAPLAADRQRLAGRATLALADPEALAIVNDKRRTFELAQRLGVPMPRTAWVGSVADAERCVAELAWPVVIKPERSRWLDPRAARLLPCKVSYANNSEQLLAQVRSVNGRYGLLLQQYCPGHGCGVEMLAHQGRVLALFQHRRLAELPITGGASAWRESVAPDPLLVDYARRMVEALSWTGLIMVEFKHGDRAYLMEINGRVWGSLPLAVHSGVDFPLHWAKLCLAPQAPPLLQPTTYQVGVRAHNPEQLLLWCTNVLLSRRRQPFLATPRRREAWPAVKSMLTRQSRSDFAAADDPRPSRAHWRRILRRVLRAGKREP